MNKPIQSEITTLIRDTVNDPEDFDGLTVEYNGIKVTMTFEQVKNLFSQGLYRFFWSKYSGQLRKVDKIRDEVIRRELVERGLDPKDIDRKVQELLGNQ